MNNNSKAAAVSTVGYLCLALAGWMFSMGTAAWYTKPYDVAIFYPLTAVLAVMAILAFVQGRALDSIVFFAGTALLGSACAYGVALDAGRLADPLSYLGWFAGAFAVFFCYIWAGSLKSGVNRMLFLLGAWLTMLALAIGCWSDVSGFLILGGYIVLVTSIFATITSATEVLRMGVRIDPNFETSVGTGPAVKPIAAD